jgi:hypothetical protein
MSQVTLKKWYESKVILISGGILLVLIIIGAISGGSNTPSVSNTANMVVNTAVNNKAITNKVGNSNKPATTNTVVNIAKATNTSAASVNTSKVNTSVAPVNTIDKNVVPAVTQSASACVCDGSDLDCPDFSTHEQAQACYVKCNTEKGRDVFGLDGDNDGSACESNPSSTPTTVTNTAPAVDTTPTYTAPSTTCCKVCTTGKACGDSCISRSYTCHKAPGCACDG